MGAAPAHHLETENSMSIQTLPLQSIQPPQRNPRRSIDPSTIEGLAASIRQDGLLQNLVVIKGKGKQYRIISGERRYRALKLLQERGEIAKDYGVKVEVRNKLTTDDVLRLATVENVQRENLPPLDEAASFAALIHKGNTLDDLAAKTGLSPTTIKRRLALNDLCDEAKEALASVKISLSQAEALTLGDHDAQRSVLGDIESGYGPYSAADIRDHLLDERPSVAMAIFPLEQYTGTITTDLFAEGESSYFDDAEQFMALQREAVTKIAKEYEGKVAWVEVTDSHRIPEWQYRKTRKKKESGVLINLSPSGRVEIREGLAKSEIDPETRSATADNPVAPKKPKAAYSTPLCRYIGWHKTLAVQELLLGNPRKAKEVAVIDRLLNLNLHEGVTQLSRQESQGSAYAAIESQARLFVEWWAGFGIEEGESIWNRFPPKGMDALTLYEAVQGLSDQEIDDLHTLLAALSFGQTICERLDTRDSLFNRVARDLDADMRNHWRPCRAFLERRSREQLVAIAKDCGYAEGVGSIGSFKKSELVTSLLRFFASAHAAAEPTPAQRKAREWLPEAMLFPAVDPAAQSEDENLDEPFDDEGLDEAA